MPIIYYYISGGISFCFTYFLLYVYRLWFGRFLLDSPGGLKRHNGIIPLVGGCGLLSGIGISVIFFMLVCHISYKELNSIIGLLCGVCIMFIIGLVDDLKKPKGLSVSIKLLFQIISAICLFCNGFFFNIFQSVHWNLLFSLLWMVGLINAFNLMDIIDGLCSSQAIVSSISIFIIAISSESGCLNCMALALGMACLGFIPHNFSNRHKCFLGDSGSYLIGYLVGALCLCINYSESSFKTICISFLVVAIPIVDITFVIIVRMIQGKNPLTGSRDHIALKLKDAGWSLSKILLYFTISSIISNIIAFALSFNIQAIICMLKH